MGNILLIIVALNIAIKYYSKNPDGESRSLVLLLLSLLRYDIESVMEGTTTWSAGLLGRQSFNVV